MPMMTTKTSPFSFRSGAVAGSVALLLAALSACGGDDAGPGKPSATAQAPSGKAAASELVGSSATLAYQTGREHLEKGDFEKAQAEFERAIQLDPKVAEVHFELGKLLVQQSNQKVWAKARDLDILGKGIAELTRAVELEPGSDPYLFHLGRAYYLKDDLENAKLYLGKAVASNPKSGGAWKALGQAQVDGGQTELGRDSFRHALEANPEDANAHYKLAQALEVLGDLAGARADYEKSIELDPTAYEVHGRLSQVCGKLGDAEGESKARVGMDRWKEFDERLQRRTKAVNQSPDSAVALRRLGEMYFEIGDWEKALEWFLRAIHIDTRDWRAHLFSGVCRRHQKDYIYATKFLKEAEFLAPDVLDPKLELVRLYADKKDDASLDQLVRTFEAEAAQDGDSTYFMAEVCREVGREEDAKRLFGKAAALGVTETPTAPALAEDAAEGE